MQAALQTPRCTREKLVEKAIIGLAVIAFAPAYSLY